MKKTNNSIRRLSAIFFAVPLCIGLCACNKVILPRMEKLAVENDFLLELPFSANIQMNVTSGSTKLRYYSTVTINRQASSWDGKALMQFGGLCFQQGCSTKTNPETGAYKTLSALKKLGCVKTDTISPYVQILEWMGEVEYGAGSIDSKTVVPSEACHFLEGVDDEAYCVTLYNHSVKWNSITDVYIDDMFGGQELITQFADRSIVRMYFRTTDMALTAITIQGLNDKAALEAAITLTPTDEFPNLLLMFEETEGNPYEQWDYLSYAVG